MGRGRAAQAAACGVLMLVVAACGDDGGGGVEQAAFCDGIEELSGLVGDGALDDDLPDVLEAVNGLILTAPDDELEGVEAVAAAMAGGQDGAELGETIQSELGDAAEGCDVDDAFELADAPPEDTTTTEPPDDTTTTEPPEDTTTVPDTGGGTDPATVEVNARLPLPPDLAAEFVPLAQACFDGDPISCDTLFATTPIDSVDEDYGDTCAGRVAGGTRPLGLTCDALMLGPVEVPADVVDVGNAQLCFDGDMVACDTLFNTAAEGSTDRTYGALCGVRVQNTTAFCVDIFGPQSLFL